MCSIFADKYTALRDVKFSNTPLVADISPTCVILYTSPFIVAVAGRTIVSAVFAEHLTILAVISLSSMIS